jgi:hypothetical protein
LIVLQPKLVLTGAETNRIGDFQRMPSDLRKYLEYMSRIEQRYGSVHNFIVQERLKWGEADLKPRGRPFEFDGE